MTSSLSQDTVTITRDQTVAVTAANIYTRDIGTLLGTKSAQGRLRPVVAGGAVRSAAHLQPRATRL